LRGDRTAFLLEIAPERAALRGYAADLHPQRRSAWNFNVGGE
jgi:hypothetical protein